MSEEQEAGFLIDGAEYPIPDVNTFNLDEDELLWQYARLTRNDFVRVDPTLEDAEEREAERRERLRHPGLMRTLVHVAYQRGNPDAKQPVVKRLVGQTTLDSLMSLVMAEEPAEDDAGPPDESASTSTPKESSTSSKGESESSTKPTSEPSGNGSPNGSDEPASLPASTGTGG